ncbi:MAG: DNA alkylation repair protein [Saprospiraceae bacterium]|nr:DNA alkylation repair protein [Saprospiraceae bacterium]
MVTSVELITTLQSIANPETLASQTRFGIKGQNMLGVSLYDLRRIAKGIKSHSLAMELRHTGIHEARMLAAMVDEPHLVTLDQMESWVMVFDSWDICDIVTDELFIHTPDMLEVIPSWAAREEEFVKRAAFAMIAALVVHRKDVPDEVVRGYFQLIEEAANDDRNFVKKAVNWALRNIGKWRPALRPEALACAQRLLQRDSRSASWIAKDALREFTRKFGGIDEI